MKKLFIAMRLFVVFFLVLLNFQAMAQDQGRAYVLRAGESLSELAGRFLGDRGAWPEIVDDTNAMAQKDATFVVIDNPDRVFPGQKVWIEESTAGKTAGHVQQSMVQQPMDQSGAEVSPGELQKTFAGAVRDAAIVEPDEISRNLIAITPENQALKWREKADGGKQVRVVTWTSWEGYDEKIGQEMPLSREIWVTTVPEVKDFCRHFASENPEKLGLRLEQLLGLPPGNGKTRFVEIWVNPQDLFRPSPDPEISDHEAQLEFPASPYFSISEEYVKWFEDLKSKSYGEGGYPWTRLGYTYDWGNPKSEVGASEFVVTAKSTITVHEVMSTRDYCK